PLTKSKRSPELREQLTWLLESQYEELVSAIAESRSLDAAGAKRLIDGSPYGDDVVVDSRAVDLVIPEEDLPSGLGGRIGTWEQASPKMRRRAPSVSRGGSSTASEAMRLALNVIAKRKPVVVVMGPVAGSGGYWVATPASWIVARPGTLTGSIGVLGGKIITGGLWPKLLFNRETIAFG